MAAAPTVLTVWAHPDDEAFLAAGTIAESAAAGSRVVCAYATAGEDGWQGPSSVRPVDLGHVRTQELGTALAALGVDDHRSFGYPDGRLADVPQAVAVGRIRTLLDEVQPDVVLTFGPDGFTGHPDHKAVSAWVSAALGQSGAAAIVRHAAVTPPWVDRFAPALHEFNAFWPGYPLPTPLSAAAWELHLEPRLQDRKIAALRAHHSQTERLFTAFGEPFLRDMTAVEWFRRPPLQPLVAAMMGRRASV